MWLNPFSIPNQHSGTVFTFFIPAIPQQLKILNNDVQCPEHPKRARPKAIIYTPKGRYIFSWGGEGRAGASEGRVISEREHKRGGPYLFVIYSRGGSHIFSRIF